MNKTPKNHPQTMAHRNLFNCQSYTTCYIRLHSKTLDCNDRHSNSLIEYYGPLTLSSSREHTVSDREVNLILAPQSPNFYPSDVGSSKSLRHLTRYGCSAPACVLRIATAKATYDETEAFHRRRRETLRPASHVMKGATSDCVGPSTYGSFGRLPFFIATWITDPASTPLISAKHVPRFSLGQMEGRSQNGLPFSLIKSRTQCDRFNIPNLLALPRKWTRPNNF
jgi:hypothetical protein